MNEAPWPDLQAFLAVARTGSLAAAAEILTTSAPTLGRRIAALEADLGVRLFTKATAGYRLTQSGEQLVPAAEAAEQAMLAFLRRRDGLSQEVSGTVRIAAPETIVTHLLAPRLPDLRIRHPALTVTFSTGPALVSLPRRDADLALRIGRPGEDELLARKVGDIVFRAYAPRAAQLPVEEMADLKTVPWIGWGEDFAALPIARSTQGVFARERQAAAASAMHLQVILAKQLGAALLAPDFVGAADPDLIELLDDVLLTQPLWLVASAEARGAARTEALTAWVAEAVRTLS
ncbi:LysR family transcriptional regulator [Microvirga sp. TS319]|uniref:LysR family transcriptional regulator n=1 Tax=Microvirga sp. TS319 TaxID=3241165 RepID=UPI00351A600F